MLKVMLYFVKISSTFGTREQKQHLSDGEMWDVTSQGADDQNCVCVLARALSRKSSKPLKK